MLRGAMAGSTRAWEGLILSGESLPCGFIRLKMITNIHLFSLIMASLIFCRTYRPFREIDARGCREKQAAGWRAERRMPPPPSPGWGGSLRSP